MSLIRFLAAGSSLRGIKDRRSPYKMVQQNLLPKFGAEKGEEKAPAPQAAPTPQPPAVSRPVVRPKHGQQTRERMRMSESGADPKNDAPDGLKPGPQSQQGRGGTRPYRAAGDLKPSPQSVEKMQTSAAEGVAKKMPVETTGTGGIFRRWAQMKNPFRAKPVVRKAVPPVQAELRLESIKVVRNDLSEADLEIVPRAAAKELEPPVSGSATPQSSRVAWQRIATRLFGAGRT